MTKTSAAVRPKIPLAVSTMIGMVGAVRPDRGRSYAELAARVEDFLAETATGAGWAALDVGRFVATEARGTAERIELCCLLSGLLACLAGTEELSASQARRLWSALRLACPDDDDAQYYLALGAAEFAGSDAVAS